MPEAAGAATAPVVSVIVVTYNALDHVRACVSGVLGRTRIPLELIVVDNASDPPTREYLRSLQGVRLIQNEQNRLWCAGCNQGIRAADARSRFVLLLNSDVEILRDDWLEVMLALMESDLRVALVGPQHHHLPVGPVYGFLDGHCLLLRRAVLEEVGLLDEARWPWWGAPAELAVAAFARGWTYKVVHPDDAIVRHHGSRSKTEEVRRIIAGMPAPVHSFPDILRRHGLRPRASLAESFPAPVREWLYRRRFYHASPVGPPAAQD
jgi:GT2 family glycosyltransferase